MWRGENRLQNGTKNCRHSPTLKEIPLHEAIMKALNSVVENQGEFVGAFRENVIRVIGNYSTKDVATEYDGDIEKLQNTLLNLIEDHAKQGVIDEEFDNRYQGIQGIAEEIRELKIKKLKSVQEKRQKESYSQRVEAIDQHLKRVSCEVREFDEDLIRRLLKRIHVINQYKIEIHFKSGIIMEQKIDYYED